MGYYGTSPEQQLRDLQLMEGVRARARAAVESAWNPDAAVRANTIARAAPWMSPGLVLSLAQGTGTMEPVRAAAMLDAVRRARLNPTNRRPGERVNAAALTPGDRRLFGREREQAYNEMVAAAPGGIAPGALIGREREAIGEAMAPELRQAQRLGVLDGSGTLHEPKGERTYDRDAGQWVYDDDETRDKWQAFEAAIGVVAKEPDYERFVPVMTQYGKPALYSVGSKIITEDTTQDVHADVGIKGLVTDTLGRGIGEGLSRTIGNRRLPDPFGTRNMGGGSQVAGIQTPTDVGRAGFMAISAPLQEATGVIRSAYGASQGGPGLAGWQPQSDYLVSLSDGGMDPGDGLFVDPDSEVARERRRRERATGADINGEILTIGRMVAGGASNLGIIDPDTKPYRVLSGLVDAGVAIYADPTVLGANKIDRVSTARHLFTGGLDDFAEAGLGQGAFSRFVHRPTATGFLSGPKGTRIRENIAAEANGGQLWRDLGRRLEPAEIRDLRAATTPDEVTAALAPHLGPVYRRTDDVWNEPSRFLKPVLESRWLTDMPTPYINLADQSEILPQTERWLRNIRAPEDVTLGYLDRMVTAAGDDAGAQVRTLDVVEDMIGWSLEHVGFKSAAVRHQVASDYMASIRRAREALLDQATDTRLFDELTLGDDVLPIGNPFDQYQHADQIIALPDPRQVRRVASDFNRLIARGEKDLRLPATAMLWWQEQMWKPFTLLRGAWPVRVIPEEQFRMAGVGHASFFKDPASYVVWATSRKRDAMGHPWEEARKFQDSQMIGSGGFAAERAGTVTAGRQVRIAKGESRFMEVAAENLAELHNDDIANLVARSDSIDAAERWLAGTTTDVGAASTDKLRALAASFGVKGRSAMGRDDLVASLRQVDPTALPSTQLRHLAATLGIKGRTRMRLDELADAVRGEWGQLGARNVPGDGAEVLERWRQLNPKLAKDPSGLRTYLEMTARHIKIKTGDNPELLDAVRSGTLRGKPIVAEDGLAISKDLPRQLDEFFDVLPEQVIGQELISYGGRRKGFVEWAFANLMGKPTSFLSRSPEFKQSYWDKYEEMVSFAKPELHDAMVQGARDNLQVGPFGKRAIKRMEATPSVGDLTLEEIDEFAKGYALDQVQDLLYDLSRKSQIADTMRLVAPFGEAWREVVTRWATLLNPTTAQGIKNLRRAQQGITAARGPDFGEVMGVDEIWDPEKQEWYQPGFFWEDEFGEEVFIYPGSQWLMNRDMRLPDWMPGPLGGLGTPGIPVPLTGRVQGLNMLGSIFPGLGPVASVPVSWFLPDKPGWQRQLREAMLPFGAVTEQGSAAILDMVNFLPPWLRTGLQAALGGGYDFQSNRIWANSTMATANYLYSTGKYDTTTTEGQQALMADAKDAARNVYFLRSLTAFGAPAPPSPEFMVESNEGLIRLAVLRDDYYTMLADDPTTADERFLRRWGNILAEPGKDRVGMSMQAFTREVQGGIIPTQEFDDWANANTDLERDYSAIWAFFGPTGGEFDYDVYLKQILEGERQQLTLEEWMRFGQHHLGMMMKDKLDQLMPKNPTDEDRDWYDRGETWIRDNFPGYGDPTGRVERADDETAFYQIERALEDPRITNTSTGRALAQYWTARREVEQIATNEGYRSIAQADALEEDRVWLFEGGQVLAEQDEGFKALWNRYLRNEVEPEEEVE